MSTQTIQFNVGGYDITADFAAEKNMTVYGKIKQILLSSFTNNVSRKTISGSLAIPDRAEYNTVQLKSVP